MNVGNASEKWVLHHLMEVTQTTVVVGAWSQLLSLGGKL